MTRLRHAIQKVVRPGTFVGEGGEVNLTAPYLSRAVEATNQLLADGWTIPVVGDVGRHPLQLHESRAPQTSDPLYRGNVRAVYMQGPWVHALLNLTDDEVADDVGASAWIEPNADGAPRIRHIMLTDAPAVSGQGRPVFLRMPSEPRSSRSSAPLLRTPAIDDDRLLELESWHLAVPHAFPDPGHHLRRASLRLAGRRSGAMLTSVLNPPAKSIPPDYENLFWRVLESGLSFYIGDAEALEIDRYLHQFVWTANSDSFTLAETVAKLLVKDRLDAIAERIGKPDFYATPRGAQLALGHTQSIPEAAGKAIWQVVEKELGLELSETEREGVRYLVLGHSWRGDDSVFSIAQEIACAWVHDHVAAYRTKRMSQRLTAAQQTFVDDCHAKLKHIEETLNREDRRRKQELVDREVAAMRAACPWLYEAKT